MENLTFNITIFRKWTKQFKRTLVDINCFEKEVNRAMPCLVNMYWGGVRQIKLFDSMGNQMGTAKVNPLESIFNDKSEKP